MHSCCVPGMVLALLLFIHPHSSLGGGHIIISILTNGEMGAHII